MEQLSILRATAQRLNVTTVEELPRVAGFLASSLSSCSQLGRDPVKGLDFSGTLHKLKTRLSSLLHDRTVAGRLTAAIIIKSYVETVRPIEAAQWEPWARGLIACLNKPDSWQMKQVYVSTIIRIFLLCQHSATLQREVVSPLLPGFLNAMITALKPSTVKHGGHTKQIHSRLLPAALTCWSELLQMYSHTFRPFATRIKQICVGLLSDASVSTSLHDHATQVLCSLHLCAPKATAMVDWNQSASNVVHAVHESLDMLLRAVLEDWRSSNAIIEGRTIKQQYQKPPKLSQVDAAGLAPWKGIYQGSQRVRVLVRWLQYILRSRSLASEIPLGDLVDLLARLAAVTVPTTANEIRISSEVSRDEREELWTTLPTLHIELLDACITITKVLESAALPIISALSRLTIDLYEAEGWHSALRLKCYKAAFAYVEVSGQAFQSVPAAGLTRMIRHSCQDLMHTIEVVQEQQSSLLSSSVQKPSANGNANATEKAKQQVSGLGRAAEGLIIAVYQYLPSESIPHSLRTELDRTAILYNSQKALMASVLSPAKAGGAARALPSLIPFVARSADRVSSDLEMLLRPRMPSAGGALSGSRQLLNGDSTVIEADEHDLAVEDPEIDAVMTEHRDATMAPAAGDGRMPASPEGETEAEMAIMKKRALGVMLGSSLVQHEESITAASVTPHKRPRRDGSPDALNVQAEVPMTQQAPLAALEEHVQLQSDAIAADQDIVMHSATDRIDSQATNEVDSDDDSEIPEIDAELSSDEEEDEEVEGYAGTDVERLVP
jgi:pre-rRNA-processing protein RIX1